MSIDSLPRDRRLTILLTGGRAPCTLELARSFHAAGHRVLVAESARYHLCRVSRAVDRSFLVPSPNASANDYLEALESIVANEQVDVLLPTCEEIFFVAKGLNRLARHCAVWVSSIDQLKQLHNKWMFASLVQRLGLTAPHTRLIRTTEDWLSCGEKEWLGQSLVLKPAYSRFASRVLFLNEEQTGSQRRRLLETKMPQLSPAAPWIAQRRVDGRHLCTYSVSFEGELIAHAAYPCRYRAGAGATVYFEPITHAAALAWTRRLVAAIRFTGQIAFDFIEDEAGGLYGIECNPRATSGIHLFDKEGGLSQAFLQPRLLRDAGMLLAPHSAQKMLTIPMLGAGINAIRSIRELRDWIRDFRSAHDVVLSAADRKPGIEQLRMLFDAWRTSRASGITLSQAMTIDIEWNGEQ